MEAMSSNPSQATSFLFFSTKVITFKPCNIFELIWYSEWPLVKLGDKERFDKQEIGVKEPFPVTKCQFTS